MLRKIVWSSSQGSKIAKAADANFFPIHRLKNKIGTQNANLPEIIRHFEFSGPTSNVVCSNTFQWEKNVIEMANKGY